MSSAVDLRLQYAAVALAEELNYARAADRLHITQSALTKQIRELEDQVSVALFERDKKHVSLLRAGEAFVEEARLAILHSERAMYAAKSCGEIDLRSLTIGRSPYVWIEFVNRLFSIELPLYPQLAIQLESAFSRTSRANDRRTSPRSSIRCALPNSSCREAGERVPSRA